MLCDILFIVATFVCSILAVNKFLFLKVLISSFVLYYNSNSTTKTN